MLLNFSKIKQSASYIRFNEQEYEIIFKSDLIVSLQNKNSKKYARHNKGEIIDSEENTGRTFKEDSEFRFILLDGYIILKTSNINMSEHFLCFSNAKKKYGISKKKYSICAFKIFPDRSENIEFDRKIFDIFENENVIVVNKQDGNKLIYIVDKSGTAKTDQGAIVAFREDNGYLSIHENTIFKNCKFTISKNNKIIIMDSKYPIIGLGIWVTRLNTNVNIGSDFSCWQCELKLEESNTSVVIGNDCMFSYGISIRTTDGHAIFDNETKKILNIGESIHIGNHVWIGYGATILKGSIILDNSVVGAHSLVCNKFVKSNIVIGGVPAKILKTNINWSRKSPDML